MKSHRWIDTGVGKFLACSGTKGSSDNGFIYTILLPPKNLLMTWGSPEGVGQWTGDLSVSSSVPILTYVCSSLVTERKCLYMPLEMKRR